MKSKNFGFFTDEVDVAKPKEDEVESENSIAYVKLENSGYFAGSVEEVEPKDLTKKIKDTSFVEKEEEGNRVVDKEKHWNVVYNPFAARNKREEDEDEVNVFVKIFS